MFTQFIRDVIRGGVAGFVATIPMTAVMEGLRRSLPLPERYPLPPRLITASMLAQSGCRKHLTQDQEAELAGVAHFVFGSAMGAGYGALSRGSSKNRQLRGALYGCVVWAINYQGLLPVLGIYPPATEHPERRVALMIAAHIVWGVALSEIDHSLRKLYGETNEDDGDRVGPSVPAEELDLSPEMTAV